MSRARDTAGIIQYNKISIDSNNAVGIGSSIPDTKLDVNGGVRVTGIITASSFQGDGSALTGISTENLAPNTLEVAGISTFNNALLLNNSLSKINTTAGVNVVFQDQGSDKIHFEVQSQGIRPETSNTGEIGNASYPFAKVTAQNALLTQNLSVYGGADVTGVVTTSALKGFDYLQAPHSNSTVNFAVTVAAKTTAHRYEGTGSSNGYVIDGVQSPFLTLTPGITYRFTLDSSDMTSHPFRFYLEADKTTAYTTNVTSTATYTEIEVTDTTPTVLHYQCSAHAYMGNAVQVNSNKVDTPYRIDVTAGGANITGIVTATSFTGSGANLTDVSNFDWRDGSLFS